MWVPGGAQRSIPMPRLAAGAIVVIAVLRGALLSPSAPGSGVGGGRRRRPSRRPRHRPSPTAVPRQLRRRSRCRSIRLAGSPFTSTRYGFTHRPPRRLTATHADRLGRLRGRSKAALADRRTEASSRPDDLRSPFGRAASRPARRADAWVRYSSRAETFRLHRFPSPDNRRRHRAGLRSPAIDDTEPSSFVGDRVYVVASGQPSSTEHRSTGAPVDCRQAHLRRCACSGSGRAHPRRRRSSGPTSLSRGTPPARAR